MLAKISQYIVGWQINKGILREEERAVYQYGYELLLNQVINILIAVLIAIAFKSPGAVFIFLLSYIPLRSFCGGYHAGTNLTCTIVSAFILCGVCLVTGYVQESPLLNWYPITFAVSGYFILRYAPVADRNKPLEVIETMKYRSRSRIIWGIQTVIGILLYPLWQKYGVVIAISHLVLLFMLCLGIRKNTVSLSGNR